RRARGDPVRGRPPADRKPARRTPDAARPGACALRGIHHPGDSAAGAAGAAARGRGSGGRSGRGHRRRARPDDRPPLKPARSERATRPHRRTAFDIALSPYSRPGREDRGSPAWRTEMTEAREHLLDWLRDAHAMEQQAEQMLKGQAARIENYPKLKARIEQHIQETLGQQQLLEGCIQRLGGSPSVMKDTLGKVMAMGQAVGGMMASDEIVKG